jgi:hypothetical protein
MVNGIAFLTVVIATISAAFVEGARRRAEQERVLDDSLTAELRRLDERLAQIEKRLSEGGGSLSRP